MYSVRVGAIRHIRKETMKSVINRWNFEVKSRDGIHHVILQPYHVAGLFLTQ